MTYLDFADRHPVLVALAAAGIGVTVVAIVAAVVGILVLAQVRLTEEEARARPRYFALVGLCKTIGPVVASSGKWLVGVTSTLAAQALVSHFFGPAAAAAVRPSLGPPPPSPAPSLPEIGGGP